MAKKKVAAIIKIQIPAGKATPAPPVGTALGPHGVGIMDFVKQYNAATESQVGTIIPVEITVFEDRTFTLHAEDAADAGAAAPEGRRSPRARPRRARPPPAPSPRPTSKRSPRSRCPTSTPTTSRPPRSRCAAPPARWASRSADAPGAPAARSRHTRWSGITSPGGVRPEGDNHVRQEVRRRGEEVRPRPAVHARPRRSAWSSRWRRRSSTRPSRSPCGSGVDPRKADQMVRGTVALPERHRQGRPRRRVRRRRGRPGRP